MDKKFKLDVRADLVNLSQIADFILQNALELGLDNKSIFQLQLAVDEVASNIILHGYTHHTGPIHLTIWKENEKVILRIEDHGDHFNPLNAKKPDLTAPLEKRSPGGLGIHFLKTLTDSVHYEFKDGKNSLTVIKKINKTKIG
jgi:serine/threonine-protein kinase RsbW